MAWIALPVFTVVVIILFGSSDDLSVRQDGSIVGWVSLIRSSVQGRGFWEDQLRAADQRIEYLEGEPERDAAFRAEMREWEAEADAEMEAWYREFPEFRPSPAELRAERLRRRADAIEQKGWDREWERDRRRELRELRKTREVILRRLEQ